MHLFFMFHLFVCDLLWEWGWQHRKKQSVNVCNQFPVAWFRSKNASPRTSAITRSCITSHDERARITSHRSTLAIDKILWVSVLTEKQQITFIRTFCAQWTLRNTVIKAIIFNLFWLKIFSTLSFQLLIALSRCNSSLFNQLSHGFGFSLSGVSIYLMPLCTFFILQVFHARHNDD